MPAGELRGAGKSVLPGAMMGSGQWGPDEGAGGKVQNYKPAICKSLSKHAVIQRDSSDRFIGLTASLESLTEYNATPCGCGITHNDCGLLPSSRR